jgi:hypothetical protein
MNLVSHEFDRREVLSKPLAEPRRGRPKSPCEEVVYEFMPKGISDGGAEILDGNYRMRALGEQRGAIRNSSERSAKVAMKVWVSREDDHLRRVDSRVPGAKGSLRDELEVLFETDGQSFDLTRVEI